MNPAMAAAVTERIVRMETEIEKPVKFTVRAAATVRRRRKENVKGMIANQIDAYSDKIGRNVVLELISTEIDPSEIFDGFFELFEYFF